jgi:phage terminase large subunit GpA-like protein
MMIVANGGITYQSVWSEAEARAWSVPEKLTPSQWAATHRYLPPSVAAESGKYNPQRTPYIASILDAVIEETVEEIVFLKCVQVGWSTALETITGYWIDQDAGPCLFVLPSEAACGEVVEERLRPLIETSPALKRHQLHERGDDTKAAIRLDTMTIFMAHAGSPSALARRACRYVVFDEVDKFPTFSGREADPISLGKGRTATYLHRRRVLIGSTPTTREGAIWKAWESCGDQRRFHVPCPHCGEFQPLVFGQLKWPDVQQENKAKKADTIQTRQLAWYECSQCKERITEGQKQRVILKGVWVSSGQSVTTSGEIVGPKPKEKRVGFWINALYSPWRSFSDVAAESIRSDGDVSKKQNFRNSWLAEPFEEQVKAFTTAQLNPKIIGAPRAGIVPSWAQALFATCDVQKGHIHWLLRAWGVGHRSQLIHYGMAVSFDEVRKLCLDTAYPHEGHDPLRPHLLLCDTRYRKDEVLAFALCDERIRPIMGAGGKGSPIKSIALTKNNETGVAIYTVDTQLYKDRLANFMTNPLQWLLNDQVQEEYLQEIASEHKVRDRLKGIEMWKPKSEGLANHAWDMEVYQVVAAEMARLDLLEDAAPPAPTPAMSTSTDDPWDFNAQKGGSGWLSNTRNWLGR